MSYRDDLEASQARADALEKELADARSKIAELEAPSKALVPRGSSALAVADASDAMTRGAAGSPAARTWLGAPLRTEFIREVEGEIPESAYTELIEAIRTALDNVGSVSTLPGSLAWTADGPSNGIGPFVSVYFTMRDGRTRIRALEKYGGLAGVIFGAVGGGVGGGGIALPLSLAVISPMILPFSIPLWLGAAYYSCRRLYRSRVRVRAERLEALMDELAEISEKHIARAQAEAASDSE